MFCGIALPNFAIIWYSTTYESQSSFLQFSQLYAIQRLTTILKKGLTCGSFLS